jgi:hypothetical protein
MRPTVVAAILGFGLIALAAVFFLPRAHRNEPPDNIQAETPAVTQTVTSAPANIPPPPPPPTYAEPVAATAPAVQPTNHAAYVQSRVAELMALAMNNDSNSLNTIWSELSNPDKDIRAGALAAVVQFDDPSVAPRLRTLADQTEDPSQKAAILAAANYLQLPPLTDLPPVPPSKNPRESQQSAH